MIRLFYGLTVPPEVAAYLNIISSLNKAIRWLPEENLHLTLLFIGDIPSETAEKIIALEPATSRGFEIRIENAELKNKHTGGLIWLKCSSPEGIRSLHKKLLEAVSGVTRLKDAERPFMPHITIVRSRQKFHLDFPQPPSITFNVSSYHLYQSIQSKDGVRYRSLKEYKLQEEDAE